MLLLLQRTDVVDLRAPGGDCGPLVNSLELLGLALSVSAAPMLATSAQLGCSSCCTLTQWCTEGSNSSPPMMHSSTEQAKWTRRQLERCWKRSGLAPRAMRGGYRTACHIANTEINASHQLNELAFNQRLTWRLAKELLHSDDRPHPCSQTTRCVQAV